MSRFVPSSWKSHPALTVLKNYLPGLPVVSFRFSEAYRTKYPEVKQKWIQTLLRAKGWIVPNYELAPDLSEIEILRVVIRETVSEVLIERLVADIVSLSASAQASPTHLPVFRSTSPSLSPKPIALLTPSISLGKDGASVTRFTTGSLTRILEPRVLAPMPSNVKKQWT
jgi:hypothetical protein